MKGDYTWNIVISVIIFVVFFLLTYSYLLYYSGKSIPNKNIDIVYRLFLSIAVGSVFAFIYLNSFDLPSKVTEKDRAIIHFLYLLNIIIISLFVIYCVWRC